MEKTAGKFTEEKFFLWLISRKNCFFKVRLIFYIFPILRFHARKQDQQLASLSPKDRRLILAVMDTLIAYANP